MAKEDQSPIDNNNSSNNNSNSGFHFDTQSNGYNNTIDATRGRNIKIDFNSCNFEIKIDCNDILSKLLASGKDTNEAVQACLSKSIKVSASEKIQGAVKEALKGALKAARATKRAKKTEGPQKAASAEVPEAKAASDVHRLMLKRPLASTAEEESVLKNLVEDIRRRGEDSPRFAINPADFPNWKRILTQIVAETGFDFSNKLLISKASGESWEDPCCQANASNAANAANGVQFVKLKKPLSSPAEEESVLKSLVEEIRRRGEDSPRFVINPADFPNWQRIMRKIILETGFDTNHKLMLGQPPCECCSNCTNSENETHQRSLKTRCV